MFEFKFPKTLNGWAILVAVFSYILNLFIRITNFLFVNRGSSKETKQEFQRMESDNEKRHQEIKSSIIDLKDSFSQSLEKLVSKEAFELRLDNLKTELQNEIKIKFIKMQGTCDKAIENANRQSIEARGMKQQLREVFKPLIEDFAKNKSAISDNIKKILDKYEE